MEPAMKVALIRGSIIGVLTAGATFFTTLSAGMAVDGVSDSGALIMAGISAGTAFFGIMVSRVGGEGTIDAARDARDGRIN